MDEYKFLEAARSGSAEFNREGKAIFTRLQRAKSKADREVNRIQANFRGRLRDVLARVNKGQSLDSAFSEIKKEIAVWSEIVTDMTKRRSESEAKSAARDALDRWSVLGVRFNVVFMESHEVTIPLHTASYDLLIAMVDEITANVAAEKITAVRRAMSLARVGRLSTSDMVRQIEDTLLGTGSSFKGGVGYHARRIVQTTLGQVQSLAQQEARERADEELDLDGAIEKEWNHGSQTVANGARSGHVQMDGQRRAIKEKFRNPVTGRTLLYPHDPEASLHEVVNCRCVAIDVVKENFDPEKMFAERLQSAGV